MEHIKHLDRLGLLEERVGNHGSILYAQVYLQIKTSDLLGRSVYCCQVELWDRSVASERYIIGLAEQKKTHNHVEA